MSPAPREGSQRLDQPRLLPRAQPGRRLVEQEHRRPLREGASDREKPELPEREDSRRIRRAAVEPDDLESSMSLLPDPLLLTPLPGQTQHALDEARARPNVRADRRVVEHVELAERTSRLEDGRRDPCCARRCGGHRVTSRPSTRTAPLVDARKPEMHPSSVDLPAPFGPMRQVSEPSTMPSETSSTAATAPNAFVTPESSHASCSLRSGPRAEQKPLPQIQAT